jgi:hypothetical protein
LQSPGGWAGGEAALAKFREEAAKELAATKGGSTSTTASSSSSSPKLPAAPEGKAPIYLGFSKE